MEKNTDLMEKLIKLNELEISKSKILIAIFVKTARQIMNQKIQTFQTNFEEQARFYDQDLENYEEIYHKMLEEYQEQLSEIIDKYKELYINMQLELQEAECNQKIAITNLKKSSDIKQEILSKANRDLIIEYKRKIGACMQKKNNYEVIIEACEKELENCVSNMQKRMKPLFEDRLSQISVEQQSPFKKWIHKIENKFTGSRKFKRYVIEPMNMELETIDQKMPDIKNNITQEAIHFIAKIKQAKDETNKVFENTMNGQGENQ